MGETYIRRMIKGDKRDPNYKPMKDKSEMTRKNTQSSRFEVPISLPEENKINSKHACHETNAK